MKDDEGKYVCENNTRDVHDETTTCVKSVYGKTEDFKGQKSAFAGGPHGARHFFSKTELNVYRMWHPGVYRRCGFSRREHKRVGRRAWTSEKALE